MKLKEFRRSRGMTTAEVARALGKSQSAVSKHEQDAYIHQVNVPILRQYAELYGCTIAELIGEAPPVQRGTLDHAASKGPHYDIAVREGGQRQNADGSTAGTDRNRTDAESGGK